MGDYTIYIHLPFCASKCPYCDFHSIAADTPPYRAYRQALQREWRSFEPHFGNRPLRSVYLGGGTPSLWPEKELSALLDSLPLTDGAEVTVEINPGTIDPVWLGDLRRYGVNRVSIGVQAMDPTRLTALGRKHTVDDARDAIAAAHRLDFRSISADMIYGTPGHAPNALADELRALADTGIDHLSAYELTIAEGTPFGRRRDAGRFVPMAEDRLIALWYTIQDVLQPYGLSLYEVSSYAKPDHASRHNRHYWTGGEYVGLGSGAHGFVRYDGAARRYANTKNIDAYISYWMDAEPTPRGVGEPPRTLEHLSPFDLAKERVMTGLRTTEGVDFTEIFEMVPPSEVARWRRIAASTVDAGLPHTAGGRLIPTLAGLLRADGIAEEFF